MLQPIFFHFITFNCGSPELWCRGSLQATCYREGWDATDSFCFSLSPVEQMRYASSPFRKPFCSDVPTFILSLHYFPWSHTLQHLPFSASHLTSQFGFHFQISLHTVISSLAAESSPAVAHTPTAPLAFISTFFSFSSFLCPELFPVWFFKCRLSHTKLWHCLWPCFLFPLVF